MLFLSIFSILIWTIAIILHIAIIIKGNSEWYTIPIILIGLFFITRSIIRIIELTT
jgi:hypothetical protein